MEKTNAELKAEIERLQLAVHRWMQESNKWQQESYKLRQQNQRPREGESKMRNWKRKLQDTLYMDGAVTHTCNALGEVVLWDENFDGVDGLRVVVLAHPYARDRYEITIEQDERKWQAGFYETDPNTYEYRAFEAAYFFRNLEELFTLDMRP